MTKDKDLNDIVVEKMKKGEKPKLTIVDEDFYIPDETSEIKNKYLEKMNSRHALVASVGGKTMIMCWVFSEVFNKDIIEFKTQDSIVLQYGNETIPTEGKGKETISLGKWWLQHPERREYHTIIFDPRKPAGFVPHETSTIPSDGYWNMWEGFGVQEKQGCWRLTKYHIWRILCNKSAQKFKYFVKWMAWAVQNPGVRAEVAVAFKGKKGAGKGFIFTQLLKIFGRHGMSISNAEHLTGKHNAHLMYTSFLFADEAYYPGNKSMEGVLKQLITEEYLTVEPKFQTTKMVLNCLHIGMSTNADWIIPASSDERRYFINEVDNKYAKGILSDKEREAYHEKVWAEMDNGGREAMLYDLKRYNLKGWKPHKGIPETKEMDRQKALSLGKKEKHIMGFLEDGRWPGKVDLNGRYIISSKELMDYLKDLGDPGSELPMRIKGEVLQQLGATKIKMEGGARGWAFPDLKTMRLKFNEHYVRIEWEDYDDWELDKRPTF